MKKLITVSLVSLLIVGCTNSNVGGGQIVDNKEFVCAEDNTYPCYVTYWRDGFEKAFVFSWDDNVPWHKDVAALFDEHNLKTTFFINTGLFYNWKSCLMRPLNYFYYKEIASNGHELGTHTSSNVNLLPLSRERQEWEMKMASEQLHEIFDYWPSAMSHPTSHYDEVIDSLCHIYYLDSRYSTQKDKDSLFVNMRIKTEYDFEHYKQSIDSFVVSNASIYMMAGHSMDGRGYEPIRKTCLDSLLTYLQKKYSRELWITTFENTAMYELLRDNVTYTNTPGLITFNLTKVVDKITRFTHPDAVITLCFPKENLDFSSEGLVDFWYEDGNSYVSVDLRKTNKLKYCRIK